METPEGADPQMEGIIIEYLRGLMQKAQGARAEKVLKPPVDPDASAESMEPSDDEMLELGQASGLDACAECGKPKSE
ncbi:hypothetical protein, partial [Streptococcus pseudopneumoniae]|uniref:hypothetical protein n=1 Tax=Streptococcus pseudopneumoniae TaxID=257758 RepID=UPI0018B0A18C